MTDARPLTGRHVLIITLSAFGVIIAANLAMLFAAMGAFPGLVVNNAYVASQGWDAATARQRALGWRLTAEVEGPRVTLHVRDGDADATRPAMRLILGRPASDAEDRVIALPAGTGPINAPGPLGAGAWLIRLQGDGFRASVKVHVEAAANGL